MECGLILGTEIGYHNANLLRIFHPSIFSIILVALFITINTIKVNRGDDPPKEDIDLAPQGFEAVLTVISYCSLSFICHFQLLPLQKELPKDRQTKGRLYFIVVGAIVMAYLIYNVVIFSAYFNVCVVVVWPHEVVSFLVQR